LLTEAAGKFKETRNGAILEAVINLISSIIFINYFGIIGVLLGTLTAGIIRTIEYAVFSIKSILKVSAIHIVKHYFFLFLTPILIYFSGKHFLLLEMSDYLGWIGNAIIVAVIACIVTAIISFVFYRKQVLYLLIRVKKRLSKQGK